MAKFDDTLYEIVYKGSDLFKSFGCPCPCWHCGDLTRWIDINFGAFLCSEECENAKWDEYFKAERESYKMESWSQKIDVMSSEELKLFAIHTMGLLSTYPPFDTQTPDEIFEFLDKIGKDEKDE